MGDSFDDYNYEGTVYPNKPSQRDFNNKAKDYCEQNIGKIKILVGGYVVEKDYCTNCGSINVKVSKKGYKYCGEICWKKQN